METHALTTRRLEHPAPDGDDQARLLRHGDELVRRDRPALRMNPAKQCLDTENLALCEADDGLVVQLELVEREGMLKVGTQL